jgi:GT2 family glycosyltransferase
VRAALVITTYNNPRFLELCLRSLAAQKCKDFDVFIADDGSMPETRVRIDSLRRLFPNQKINHHWHEDKGYRKSTINNEVFRHLGDYPVTICIDHDVILHPLFIQDHLSIHGKYPNACFMGRRVELGPWVSMTIDEDNVVEFCKGLSLKLVVSELRGETQNAWRAWRVASPILQKLLKRDRVPDLLGSNFSVTTELLCQVNGYNEDFQSYWGEDGDLFVRLRNTGATLIGLKGFAIQYHLYHRRLEPNAQSQARYQELLKDTSYTRCPNGIVKLPSISPSNA